MRVTHVITRLIVGGAQENTIASVLGLNGRPGVQAELISGPSTGPEGSLEECLAGRASLLTTLPALVRPIHPWKDLLASRALSNLFKKRRPDIVHTHSGKAGVLGRLAAARAGVPVVVHTIHGPSFGPFQGSLANSLFLAAERHAARRTTHFVVVAEAMRRQYLEAGIGRSEMYTTVWSGFDLQPFLRARNNLELRARFGLSADDIVLGKIARLFKLKGHDDLFAVAPLLVKRCPRIRFLLVGDGEWRGRFERMARDLGLARHFVFAGLVPPTQVPDLMGIMDLVVHLSRREGLARALPQALAAARPLVAYDCDGAAEVCVEGETGFLVKPGDSNRLVEAILSLADNPDLRDRLGTQGRRMVIGRFSVEQMVDNLHALYTRLSAGKP